MITLEEKQRDLRLISRVNLDRFVTLRNTHFVYALDIKQETNNMNHIQPSNASIKKHKGKHISYNVTSC